MKIPKLLTEFIIFKSVTIRLESKELPKYMNLVNKRLLVIAPPPNTAVNFDDSICFELSPKGQSLLNEFRPKETMSDKALDNCLNYDIY